MMTLSMPSALYQSSNQCVSFPDLNAQQIVNRLSSSPSSRVPTVNLNAAISSSLKLKHEFSEMHTQSSALNLLDNTISFHRSPATSLDELVKSRIESIPNSLVLVTKTRDPINESSDGICKTLFPDSELLKCCKNAQIALPRINLGLSNAGNTCYLNSVLQCLLATGSVLYFISECHNRPGVCAYANGKNGRRFCVLCALYQLFQEHGFCTSGGVGQYNNNNSLLATTVSNNGYFGSQSTTSILPSLFVANVRAVCPNLRPYAQEDAHEYLLGLLSRMEDSVLAGLGKVSRQIMDSNVIRRIFGGTTRSEVTCSACNKISSRNDQWFNLSMDITQARTLQQCLVNYTQPEILQGSNAYKCENCKQLRHARRCCRIYTPPPVLIIQFNRFSRSQKLDFRVDFPHTLNIRPYMTPSQDSPVIYNLFATLNHEGFSCRSGHYVAFTKRHNKWFSHNDSCVAACPMTPAVVEPRLVTNWATILTAPASDQLSRKASPENLFSSTSNGSSCRKSSQDDPCRSAPPVTSNKSTSNNDAVLVHQPIPANISTTSLSPSTSLLSVHSHKPAIIFHPRVLIKAPPRSQFGTSVTPAQSCVTRDVDKAIPSTPIRPYRKTSIPGVFYAPWELTPGITTTQNQDINVGQPRSTPSVRCFDQENTKMATERIGVFDELPKGGKFKEENKCNLPSSSCSQFPCPMDYNSTTAASKSTLANSSSSNESDIVWVPMTKTDLLASKKRKIPHCSDSCSDTKRRHKDHRHKRRSHKKHKHKNKNSKNRLSYQ